MTRALVIGYGNELRADDGAGVVVARRLAETPYIADLQVLVRHQLTPELAVEVAAAGTVVLVDASAELPAGEVAVRQLSPSAEPGGSSSSHHMGPDAILALGRELYGGDARGWLVSIGVGSLDLGGPLSPAVEAALPMAVTRIREVLAGA
jgi:hydrogenase maturation protease